MSRTKDPEEVGRERERRLARQASVLVDLARRKALHGPALGSALHLITEAAARTLDVERTSVWLHSDDRSSIRCVDLYERTPDRHSEGIQLFAADHPLYFRALEEERAVVAHDGHTDPRTAAFSATYLTPLGISSLMDAPIRSGGHTVGVVCHEQVGPPRRWRSDEQNFAGSLADLVALAMESSERKMAQEALQRSEEHLRQAQKMEALGRMAGGIAHDFNNMLTAIIGYSDMVLRELEPHHPLWSSVKEIEKAGERAASMTQQLLAFSRRQVLQPRLIDLDAVVAEMEPMLRRLITEHIVLAITRSTEASHLSADRTQIEQVILNLALNARDAMPRGGKLTIATAPFDLADERALPSSGPKPGRYVTLAVSDTGAGMDQETQSHLFEPFFTTKEVGRGTGLGLATVDGIVQQSGGHIEVRSAPDRGSTFTVYLPRLPEAPREAPAHRPHRRLDGNEIVLLTEDDETVRLLVRRTLERHGYLVLEARNGEEALRLSELHEGPIHVLLTDVIMPGLNGRDLAQKIAAARGEMRVLFMSGYSDTAKGQLDDLARGEAFIQKPFMPDVMVQKLRELLDAR